MHERYGEPNDELGKHKVCENCGCCLICEDCMCSTMEYHRFKRREVDL